MQKHFVKLDEKKSFDVEHPKAMRFASLQDCPSSVSDMPENILELLIVDRSLCKCEIIPEKTESARVASMESVR